MPAAIGQAVAETVLRCAVHARSASTAPRCREQRSRGGDEGDLPPGHAADHDGAHGGRDRAMVGGWQRRVLVHEGMIGGGCGSANAASAAAANASRAPASPLRAAARRRRWRMGLMTISLGTLL